MEHKEFLAVAAVDFFLKGLGEEAGVSLIKIVHWKLRFLEATIIGKKYVFWRGSRWAPGVCLCGAVSQCPCVKEEVAYVFSALRVSFILGLLHVSIFRSP